MPSERVLVVPAAACPPPDPGVLPLSEELLGRLETAGEYRERGPVETDESYRQLVPYAIVRHHGRVLLLQRTDRGGDARLHNLYSIGIGGHIEPVDGTGPGVARRALDREVAEELHVGAYTARPVGIIHRDATPVERVHLGILYVLDASGVPAVREVDKLAGNLVQPAALAAVRERMEGWSQCAADFYLAMTPAP
jgi:predicted NUDIX family phosphoesterase